MNVGDVVVPVVQDRLFSAMGRYTHAIVVDTRPLVLVSDNGDMLWNNVARDEVICLCKADSKIVETAKRRYLGGIGETVEKNRREGFPTWNLIAFGLAFSPGAASWLYRKLLLAMDMQAGTFSDFVEGLCWFLTITGSAVIAGIVIARLLSKKSVTKDK